MKTKNVRTGAEDNVALRASLLKAALQRRTPQCDRNPYARRRSAPILKMRLRIFYVTEPLVLVR